MNGSAVASQRSGGDVHIVAIDGLAIEKAGQADDDHRSSPRISQRAHLSPPVLAAGRKPPVDRGEGNQPEAGCSRDEQNEGTSLAHECIGIRQLDAPHGEDAFAQAKCDRYDIGDRRDEKEKGAGIPAKDGPSENETVEKVADHVEDEDENGEVEIDLRGHVMEGFGERDRRQIGHRCLEHLKPTVHTLDSPEKKSLSRPPRVTVSDASCSQVCVFRTLLLVRRGRRMAQRLFPSNFHSAHGQPV